MSHAKAGLIKIEALKLKPELFADFHKDELMTVIHRDNEKSSTSHTKKRTAKSPRISKQAGSNSALRNHWFQGNSKLKSPLIQFIDNKNEITCPHCDVQIMRAIIAGNSFNCMLVDCENLTIILIKCKTMLIDGQILCLGQTTLAVKLGEKPRVYHGCMNFLIIDSRSAYDRILGESALKQNEYISYPLASFTYHFQLP